MSERRSRLIGSVVAAGPGLLARLLSTAMLGQSPAWILGSIGIISGGLLGLWLSPILRHADTVKTVALGVATGVLWVPLVGVLAGIPTGAQMVLAGNILGVLYPIAIVVYVSYALLTVLWVFVPAGLLWAVLVRPLVSSGTLIMPGRETAAPANADGHSARDIPEP
jgi:hypothetical protein